MPQQYPFSAVVGSTAGTSPGAGSDLTDMALSLILTTISPEVGGVLVRGEKGTAKSTIVRALAAVLPPIEVVDGDRFSYRPGEPGSPDGPFPAGAATLVRPVRLVELPVGATEDRVLGSLHLESALSHGRAVYEPGLLARAHRGILYVDEENLLHDHLVDLLLDAAAMGRSTVERDGVSVEHAARFVLVGTMNPEEGELRPQLLDRFGLTVEVAAPRDPAVRVEVVRRRMAYDADPDAFAAAYAEQERQLTERIVEAQARVGSVVLDDAALLKIAEICAAFDVDGMRGDLVTARAAIAHAAWHGHDRVTRADIRAAARLALPHRRRRNPFDAPGLDEDLLDQLLGDDDPPPPDGPDGSEAVLSNSEVEPVETPGDPTSEAEQPNPEVEPVETPTGEVEPLDTPDPDPSASTPGVEPVETPGDATSGSATSGATATVAAGDPYRTRLFSVAGLGRGAAGRRSRAVTESGRRIGARPSDGQGGSIDLVETIRAAAPHQAARRQGRTEPGLALRPDDLRVAVKEGKESNLVLFCVDASGSMAARTRMQQVKAAILSLLLDAYQRRDKVGLVTFRDTGATLALPPTSSVEIAAARLDDLPAGGRTPLAEGLATAAEALRVEAIRDPRRRTLLVVVTDGRATAGAGAVDRSLLAARRLAATGVSALVVDCETGRFRLGLARELADALQAEHLPLGDVRAAELTAAVRRHQPRPNRAADEGAA